MALNETERRLLESIAEDARKAREASIATAVTMQTHSSQISTLFETINNHADKITSVEIKQESCPAREQFTSRFQRGANNIGFWAIIVSCTISPIIATIATYYFTKGT